MLQKVDVTYTFCTIKKYRYILLSTEVVLCDNKQSQLATQHCCATSCTKMMLELLGLQSMNKLDWKNLRHFNNKLRKNQNQSWLARPCSPALDPYYMQLFAAKYVGCPNQWIAFFVRSDWLLKLGTVCAIHLPAFFWISQASFPSFLRKKELFGAGYLLVWYIPKQLFTSVSVKSGRFLPRSMAARQISTTIHCSTSVNNCLKILPLQWYKRYSEQCEPSLYYWSPIAITQSW